MMQSNYQLIPVTILTGFLGAGKTTLLNHILNGDHGLRIGVLINDFGEINIDSRLVAGIAEDDTIQLSNGCICCTIREDLLDSVEDMVDRADPPEYIIVEASGVSDPGPVATSFVVLNDIVEVDAIVAMLDADQHFELSHQNMMLAVNQIGVADIILLNKVDLAEPEEVQRLQAWIRKLTPGARILESVYAQVPLELLLGVGLFDPAKMSQPSINHGDSSSGLSPLHVHVQPEEVEQAGHSDHHHDSANHTLLYSTWHYRCDAPLDYRKLQWALKEIPTSVFRAKGFLHFADYSRRGVLQLVGKRSKISFGDSWGSSSPQTEVVFIGEVGQVKPDILRAIFEQCRAA